MRSSTPPTTRCAAEVAWTARSTGPVGRPSSRTASRGSRSGLETGDAGWTTGGNLPARWVIHVVGPNRHAGQTDRSLLTSCYVRALEVADELGARTVAFPLVSAGVYGWPKDDAIAAPLEVFRRRGHPGRGGAAGRLRPRDVRADPGAAGSQRPG